MSKEDIIRKLTSRKFWVALVAFISSILVCFNVAESDITQVTSVIMAAGSLIAYVLSEGWVDAKRAEDSPTIVVVGPETVKETAEEVDDE